MNDLDLKQLRAKAAAAVRAEAKAKLAGAPPTKDAKAVKAPDEAPKKKASKKGAKK